MADISGRVVDEDGNPIEGARVTATGPDDAGNASTSPLSSVDGGGYYRISGLEGGSYTISASHPQYRSGPDRQAQGGADGVNISLWNAGEMKYGMGLLAMGKKTNYLAVFEIRDLGSRKNFKAFRKKAMSMAQIIFSPPPTE